MVALRLSRVVRLGLGFAAGSLLASSCVVDTSGLVFDDDQFFGQAGGGGEGGEATGSGGRLVGLGGLDGLGGLSGTGGLGLGGSGNLCEPSETKCEGKQVELCANNAWVPIGGPCPNACVGGLCTGVCDPGTDACLSSIQTQHCNEVGEWEPEFCEFACAGGTCGGVCRPGERDCSNKTRTLCDETGQWVDQDTCPGDCEEGVCVGACPVGETQCSGDTESPIQVTCDAATWEESTETPCEFICDETLGTTGECGGECIPFSSVCANATSVQTCDSTANYGEPEACPYVCVDETGVCGGECVPGNEQCKGTVIQTCDDNGFWQDGNTCTGEKPICLEATPGEPACVECAPGAKMCAPSANALMTCTAAGAWPASGSACKVVRDEATLCWEDSRGAPACVPASEIDCPLICGKGGCPRGCIDSDTRWACVSGAPKSTNCTLGLACTAGLCN